MSDKDIKAFPQLDSSCFEPLRDRGMSLRDYFAAKAMQAIVELGVYSGGADMFSCVANDSYELADAMMKAREL